MKKFGSTMDIIGTIFMFAAGVLWIVNGFAHDGPDPDVGLIWTGTGLLWIIIGSMRVSERYQNKELEAEKIVNDIKFKLMADRIAYLEDEAIKTRKRTSLLG